MKKQKVNFSFSLPSVEGRILEQLIKGQPYGWLSRWVAANVRRDFFALPAYRVDVEKVIKAMVGERQAEIKLRQENIIKLVEALEKYRQLPPREQIRQEEEGII